MAQFIQSIQIVSWPSVLRRMAPFALFPALIIAVTIFTSGAGDAERAAQTASASGAPGGAPSFMSYAVATVPQTLDVSAAPGGGTKVAVLEAGSRISVGGWVAMPAGLGQVESLWVAAETAEGPVYGFVPRSAVELVAGDPPALDLSGLKAARLLAPIDGVRESDLTGAPVTVAGIPDSIEIAWLPATVRRWGPQLIAAGQRHKVDPALLAIVMLVESGGDPNARSGAGATGLMQVMPATARGIAAERGISDFSVDQLYEPDVSIDFGAWYLAQQLRSFGRIDDPDWHQSVKNAAVAYNGGPGNAQRYVKGSSVPAETRRYVEWVGGMWADREQGQSTTFERWWAAGGSRLVTAAEAG